MLNVTIERHDDARRAVAQSHAIHPDWDLDTHLAYLEDEGFDVDADATVVAWPNGPTTAPLRDYVAMWVRNPARTLDPRSFT